MSGNMIGMDVELVRRRAEQLRAHGTTLQGIEREVDSIVREIRGRWNGGVAGAFVSQWEAGQRRTLVDLIERLRELAETLEDQTRQQVDASKADGLPPGVSWTSGYWDDLLDGTLDDQLIKHEANDEKTFKDSLADPHTDVVEIDTQYLSDGTIVIYHDDEINGKKVADLTLAQFEAELKKKGEEPQLLENYLQWAKESGKPILLDVKNDRDAEADDPRTQAYANKLQLMLNWSGIDIEQVAIMSFSPTFAAMATAGTAASVGVIIGNGWRDGSAMSQIKKFEKQNGGKPPAFIEMNFNKSGKWNPSMDPAAFAGYRKEIEDYAREHGIKIIYGSNTPPEEARNDVSVGYLTDHPDKAHDKMFTADYGRT